VALIKTSRKELYVGLIQIDIREFIILEILTIVELLFDRHMQTAMAKHSMLYCHIYWMMTFDRKLA
jgi:hypothetical protein